jgi:hypothetical protein
MKLTTCMKFVLCNHIHKWKMSKYYPSYPLWNHCEIILSLIYSFIKNVNLGSYHVVYINLGPWDTQANTK